VNAGARSAEAMSDTWPASDRSNIVHTGARSRAATQWT
jgi:hypothetical protein